MATRARAKPKTPAARPVSKANAKQAKPGSLDPARRQALLEAVLADPEADAPRLVYADALTEVGDPRGELIAVQCALAARGGKTERQDPKSKPLWARFRELHSRHSAKWTKPLRALGKQTRWQLHRGFVRGLALDGWSETLTAKGVAEILAIEPVVDLELGGAAETIEALLDVQGIERLRRLGIYSQGAFVGTLPATAKRLGAVTELRLGIALGDKGVLALAGKTRLAAVRHLAVGMARCSDTVFEKLTRSPLGKQLTVLEWCREEITPAMAKAVIAMPRLETFVASVGWSRETIHVLQDRFGDGFVVESEAGDDYILGGVEGLSKRAIA